MSKDERIYKSLNLLLRMFKNRPYHLAKYLIDNQALTTEFLKKIEESDKLKEITQEENSKLLPVYLPNINKMKEYYNSFLETDLKSKSIEEVTEYLNNKLNECIKNEQYEDAARIRDYMTRKGIKKL